MFYNLFKKLSTPVTNNENEYKSSIDWEWLKKQPHIYKSKYINAVKLKTPLIIKIDGINGQGIILKEILKNDTMNEDDSSGI